MVAERDLNMAEEHMRPKQLVADAGQGPFAEGARRLEEIAQTIKAQQSAEQQAESRAAPVPPPEEVWSGKFASLTIGPVRTDPARVHAPVLHARAIVPDLSALKSSAVPVPERLDVRLDVKPGAMAERLGRKDAPRRSLLARLFGRG